MALHRLSLSARRGACPFTAAAAAALALVIAGCGGSSTSAASGGATTAAPAAAASTTAPAQAGPPRGGGGRPFGGPPVVGPAAAKVKAAALAKYPGTIQIIQQRPDGTYVAHVIRADKTEVHVLVSKAFKVTGTQTGPPGGRRPPSSGQAPA
jgi:hypothetical protein